MHTRLPQALVAGGLPSLDSAPQFWSGLLGDKVAELQQQEEVEAAARMAEMGRGRRARNQVSGGVRVTGDN